MHHNDTRPFWLLKGLIEKNDLRELLEELYGDLLGQAPSLEEGRKATRERSVDGAEARDEDYPPSRKERSAGRTLSPALGPPRG